MTDKYYNRIWNRHHFCQFAKELAVAITLIGMLYASMWLYC